MKLGEKLKKLRKDKKFTLEELAEIAGPSKSYIWELENKNPPKPSADTLLKLANALDVTLDYLLDTENEISEGDAIDAKFYRRYQKMDSKTKEKIRDMIDIWDD